MPKLRSNLSPMILTVKYTTGAHPGFFLGGGAPLRNGITTVPPISHIFFWAEFIPVALESHRSSQGEGVHPEIHPCTTGKIQTKLRLEWHIFHPH